MLISTVLVFSIALVAIFYLIFKLKHLWNLVIKINEFPGRKGYPILGNLPDFLGTADEVFEEIRKYVGEFPSEESVSAWMFLFPFILIHGPQDMERVLGNLENNNKGFIYDALHNWLGDGLLTSSGSKWHSRRKMLTPTFHFSILQSFLNVFNTESRELIKNIEARNVDEAIDVVPVITKYTIDSICQTAMGSPLESFKDGDNYRKAVHEFGKIIFTRITKTWLMIDFIYRFSKTYWQEKKVLKVLQDFARVVIIKRKEYFDKYFENNDADWTSVTYSEKKQLAMLDLLVSAQKKGEDIDDEGIRDEVNTFMFEVSIVSYCKMHF